MRIFSHVGVKSSDKNLKPPTHTYPRPPTQKLWKSFRYAKRKIIRPSTRRSTPSGRFKTLGNIHAQLHETYISSITHLNLNHSTLQHWSRFWELQIYKRTKNPMVTGFYPCTLPPRPSTTIGSGGPSSSYTWSLRPQWPAATGANSIRLWPNRLRENTWSRLSPKSLALGYPVSMNSISPRYPGSIKAIPWIFVWQNRSKKKQVNHFCVFFQKARSLVHSSTTSDTLAIVVGGVGPPIGLELTGSRQIRVVDSDIGEFLMEFVEFRLICHINKFHNFK